MGMSAKTGSCARSGVYANGCEKLAAVDGRYGTVDRGLISGVYIPCDEGIGYVCWRIGEACRESTYTLSRDGLFSSFLLEGLPGLGPADVLGLSGIVAAVLGIGGIRNGLSRYRFFQAVNEMEVVSAVLRGPLGLLRLGWVESDTSSGSPDTGPSGPCAIPPTTPTDATCAVMGMDRASIFNNPALLRYFVLGRSSKQTRRGCARPAKRCDAAQSTREGLTPGLSGDEGWVSPSGCMNMRDKSHGNIMKDLILLVRQTYEDGEKEEKRPVRHSSVPEKIYNGSEIDSISGPKRTTLMASSTNAASSILQRNWATGRPASDIEEASVPAACLRLMGRSFERP